MASEFLLLQCWFYISFLAVFANLFVNQKRFRETFRIDDNVSGMITLNSAPIWAKILFAKVYFFHLHFYSLAVYNVLVIHIFPAGLHNLFAIIGNTCCDNDYRLWMSPSSSQQHVEIMTGRSRLHIEQRSSCMQRLRWCFTPACHHVTAGACHLADERREWNQYVARGGWRLYPVIVVVSTLGWFSETDTDLVMMPR